jgi:hypothetical protein
MNFIQADSISLSIFSLAAFSSYTLIVFKLKRSCINKLWSISFTCAILLISVIVISGVALRNIIPTLPIFMIGFILFANIFSFSPAGKKLAQTSSIKLLIGFQLFRFPLELLLHHWSNIGTIPETMTWSGQNIDIWAGIISLVALPFLGRKPIFDWAVNIIGFALLMNVLRVVVMSSPFPISWKLETPLLLGVYFPYVLIVPLFVVPALVGHLVSFRKLISSST